MNTQSKHLTLHAVRTVPEVINFSFHFLRSEWRKFWKGVLLIPLIPIFVSNAIASYGLSITLIEALVNSRYAEGNSGWMLEASSWVTYLVGISLLVANVHAYFRLYQRDQEFDVADVREEGKGLFWKTLGTIVGVAVIYFLAGFVVVWISASFSALIPVLGIIVLVVLFIVIYTDFAMYLPSRLLAEEAFFDSFSEAKYLLTDNWLKTIGLILTTLGITAGLGIAILLPYWIILFLVQLNLLDMTGMEDSLQLFQGISMVVLTLFFTALQLLWVIPLISYVVQYYSLREKKEGVSLLNEINMIGTRDEIDNVVTEQ